MLDDVLGLARTCGSCVDPHAPSTQDSQHIRIQNLYIIEYKQHISIHRGRTQFFTCNPTGPNVRMTRRRDVPSQSNASWNGFTWHSALVYVEFVMNVFVPVGDGDRKYVYASFRSRSFLNIFELIFRMLLYRSHTYAKSVSNIIFCFHVFIRTALESGQRVMCCTARTD